MIVLYAHKICYASSLSTDLILLYTDMSFCFLIYYTILLRLTDWSAL
jgi:hypothetical protein